MSTQTPAGKGFEQVIQNYKLCVQYGVVPLASAW